MRNFASLMEFSESALSFDISCQFLEVFAKFQKTTIIFDTSVCLSARNSSAPNGRIFIKNFIFEYFRKSVAKVQVSLKPDKNNGTLHEDQYTVFIISHSVLGMRNVSDKFVEKIKTHILCSTPFFVENRAVYELTL